MTANEFNNKYSAYLEPKFYGLAINNHEVVEYLDKEFTLEIERDPEFQYSQIKLKFTMPIVYAKTGMCKTWEENIKKILSSDVISDIIY